MPGITSSSPSSTNVSTVVAPDQGETTTARSELRDLFKTRRSDVALVGLLALQEFVKLLGSSHDQLVRVY